ncbi:MAG: hypothetical protein ABL998_02540 [Planctomycetota bacterium]
MSDAPATFGTLFLDELRRQGELSGLKYATLQRIKAMERDELLTELRKACGPTYAELQRLKTIESPVELAREVARTRTAQNQALLIALFIALG